MVGMTYDTLTTDVLNYVKRPNDPDLIAILPTLINNAEYRLSVDLKFIYNKQVVTSTLTATQWVLPKPSDWRQTDSFQIGTGATFEERVVLYPRQYDVLTSIYPDRTQTAQPGFYADYDRANFFIAQTPDKNYPFELTYFANPLFLSENNQTNFYTQYVPSLLLKATLLETPSFLKRPEFSQMWETEYGRLVNSYNAENKGRIIDQANVRTEGMAS